MRLGSAPGLVGWGSRMTSRPVTRSLPLSLRPVVARTVVRSEPTSIFALRRQKRRLAERHHKLELRASAREIEHMGGDDLDGHSLPRTGGDETNQVIFGEVDSGDPPPLPGQPDRVAPPAAPQVDASARSKPTCELDELLVRLGGEARFRGRGAVPPDEPRNHGWAINASIG